MESICGLVSVYVEMMIKVLVLGMLVIMEFNLGLIVDMILVYYHGYFDSISVDKYIFRYLYESLE